MEAMELSTPPRELRAPPLQGVLSRTISSASQVRWILPARIRSPSKTDLLLVGDTSVLLREFVTSRDEPYLAECLCKIDFKDQILGAKVISAPVESVPMLEQISRQTIENERYIIDGVPVTEGDPPQILVLSTSRSDIVFLYARQTADGSIRFVCAKRSVVTGLTDVDQVPLHFAVDPASRFLAIASGPSYLCICALRSIGQLKKQIALWSPVSTRSEFTPWTEQRFIQVDGSIIRMDFLHSQKDDTDRVILVLLVAKEGRTYLLLYRWNTRQPLTKARPMRSSGQMLSRQDSLPLMLIPCVASASFLLVTDTELALHTRTDHAEVKRTAYAFSDPNAFKGSRRVKRWTHWGRPRRMTSWHEKEDEIILVREDGYLATYIIDLKSDVKVTFNYSPGNLNFCVDTAVCFLPAPLRIHGGDIMVAGGSLVEGGVFHLAATKGPQRIQTLSNCAPINDLLVLPTSTSSRGDLRPRVFLCNGNRQGRGVLTEVFHGIEAEAGWTIEHPDAASILRTWTLEAKHENALLILTTHPMETSLMKLGLRETELEYVDDTAFPGIDLESPTFAATTIEHDALLQVTTVSLNVVSLRQQFLPIARMFHSSPLCADIAAGSNIVVICFPDGERYKMSFCKVQGEETGEPRITDGGAEYSMKARPTCITATGFANGVVVAIATEDGELSLHIITPEGRLQLVFETSLSIHHASLASTTIGTVCLLTKPGSRIGLLLCGTRNGYLLKIPLLAKTKQEGLTIESRDVAVAQLSKATVTVMADDYMTQGDTVESAFVIYGSMVEQISVNANEAGADHTQCHIMLCDRKRPSQPGQFVNSLCRVPRMASDNGDDVAGLLLYTTPTTIIFASMVGQPRSIGRQIDVSGVAKRATYSGYLKKVVVGVDPRSRKTHAAEKKIAGSKSLGPRQPLLCFVSIDDTESGMLTIDPTQNVIIGEVGESISCMCHYSPTDGKHHFQMVVIALRSAARLESGLCRYSSRVVCVSDKHVQNGKAGSKTVMRLPGKNVTAMCPTGMSGILIASSTELLLHNLDVGTKTWGTKTRHKLPSVAKEIRVQGSLVYIATQQHSIYILKLVDNVLSRHGADTRVRISSNVVPLDRYRTVMLDKVSNGTQITGVTEGSMNLHASFETTVVHDIDHIEHMVEEERCSPSLHTSGRDTFVASAADGTIYGFAVLENDEWLLCHFLEALYSPHRKYSVKLLPGTRDIERWLSQEKPRLGYNWTAVDGDQLALMLEPGAYSLRGRLGCVVKVEDESGDGEVQDKVQQTRDELTILKGLAGKVLGRVDQDDPVGSVLIWIRALLRQL
jgi:hypothetical protein